MKKPTIFRIVLLALFFLQSFISYSQNLEPFKFEFNKDLKGDILLIGNNILNRDEGTGKRPNDAYNGNNLNSDFNMKYINIDKGVSGIFSSSSATLSIPKNNAANCYKIIYAGLYWGAVTKGDKPFKNVKFKMPTGGYHDIEATSVIYDSGSTAVGTSYPYACFADVTNLVTGAGNPTPEGVYTVANVSSKEGSNGGTGLSAGWSLFIVYEDPTLPAKSITSFNGFSAISSTVNLNIPVTGFRTIPAGPVRAKFAFAALEGDGSISGDYLRINGTTITPTERPQTGKGNNKKENFFNSSVTSLGSVVTTGRYPNSANTLGFDAGVLEINNPSNSIIDNNDDSAIIGLRSSQDVYFYYFNAIALDIIEPKIILTKEVLDSKGIDIGNTPVTLGQELYYRIGFENIGNDAAKDFTIKDILPINIVFDPKNIVVPNESGITYTYNKATRTIIFTVPNNLVEIDDARNEIYFKVQVVPYCNDLSDACSDKIQNQAFATYKGVENETQITEDPSLSSFNDCYLGTPSATNFLVGVEGCKFSKEYQLCGANVTLTAADGYDSYSWSTNESGVPVIGTTQSITVTNTGIYYVHNTAKAPCLSIDQIVTVTAFGSTTKNPVIPFADEVVICLDDRKELPIIKLCGATDSKFIQTGIADTKSIVWEKLDEVKCPNTAGENCANESAAASCWTEVANGPDYTANTEGQYRVVLNYDGGCFSTYYFNVYKNSLNPTATSRDIICETKGEIVVGGIGDNYEFSLSEAGPYQDSKVFEIDSPDIYTVYIKQKGVTTNPCIFKVPGISIRKRDFKVDVKINNPLCKGDLGSIKIAAKNVRAQYFYSISQGATLIDSKGPTVDSDVTFDKLNPGVYTINVTTDDKCFYTEDVEVVEPKELTARVTLTTALTACNDGQITVHPEGGTAPYSYFVNGALDFQDFPEIPVETAGTYSIRVVDYNGCTETVSIEVQANPKPIATITPKNIICYGNTDGEIAITVNPTDSGYTISYSKDNGGSFQPNATFSNLAAGDYNIVVKYALTATDGTVSECLDPAELITITAPSTAISASAGVASLAGCTLSGAGGLLRITNVEGGDGNYQFSFDGGATWQDSKEKAVLPGTYVLKVRDKGLCEYTIPYDVILGDKPTDPVITVDSSAFNCNGTATSTVTVTNTGDGDYAYEYLIDGKLNTNAADPKVFLNVPAGPHTITVNYKLVSVPTPSNLLFEDFGNGDENVKSPGASPNFCFENQVGAGSCGTGPALYYGEYTVTNTLHPNSWWEWNPFPKDHSGDKNGKGRFFVTDVGTVIAANDVCYRKTINDIIPNRPIEVEIWVRNLFAIGTSSSPDPNLILDLEPVGGTLATALSQQETGPVKRTNDWIHYKLTLNPGNNTSLDFAVRIKNPGNQGIDFAFDDIKVYQLPEACITKIDFPIEVLTDQAFIATADVTKDVSCAGAKDGEITITATNFNTTNGYQYSLNGGTDWNPSTTSPLVLTDLDAGTYDLKIRYDATPGGSQCVQSFAPVIKTPEVILGGAAVTSPAKCSVGATITASGQGGSGDYQYQLKYAAAGIYRDFQTDPDFLDVPAGDYEVFVKDVNGCVSPVGEPVKVDAPTTLTAIIVTDTALCFDGSAKITVNVSGGTGTYSYQTSIDGAAYGGSSAIFNGPSASFTYTATGTGTYKFKITDNYGCFVETNDQVINAKLTAKIDSTTELNCDPAKEAVITGTITGGTAPFVVTVLSGTGPGAIAYPTATTFTYTTAIASIYKFQITDDIGCVTTTTATVKELAVPIATPKKTDISCNDYNDGTITVTGSNGFGTYSYAIDKGAGFVYQSTAVFTGLAAGIYSVKVKDSKGCESAAVSETIVNPDPVTATVVATALGCSSTGTKAATVTINDAAGGAGEYTYSFNGNTSYTSDNTYSTTTARTVSVYIKDKNGCEARLPDVTITELSGPTGIDVYFETGIMCPEYIAHVKFQTIGGQSPIRYKVVAVDSGLTIPSASGQYNLPPGDYTFTATDTNECSFTLDYNVKSVPDITTGGSILTPIKCFGETGAIQFTVTGFINTARHKGYNYVIKNSANAIIQQGNRIPVADNVVTVPGPLVAGSYTIVATDLETNCTSEYTIDLTQPAVLELDPTDLTDVTCKADGTATINAKGGWGTYSYAVTRIAPTVGATINQNYRSFSDLIAGDYSFTVTDLNGCNVSGNFTIKDKVLPTASIDPTSVYCVGGVGATLKVTPDTQTNYTYTLGGTVQTNGTFTGLTPGKYTIRVTDTSTGCFIDLAEQIIASPVTASTKLLADLDCDVAPAASPDASIEVTISNGYPDYKYRVNKTGVFSTETYIDVAAGVFTYAAPTAGTYYFEIKDSKGCTTIISTEIDAIVLPTATTTPTNPTCYNGNNGSITVNASLGSRPYTYEVSTTSATTGFDPMTSNIYTGASAITYWFRVTDAKNCKVVVSRTLINPAEFTAHADVTTTLTCGVGNVSQAATITVTVDLPGTPFTGGKYKYDYGDGRGFVNSNTYTTNNSGPVNITVKDANDCTVLVSTEVLALDRPTNMTFDTPALITCETGHDKTDLTVKVDNGVPPFKFEITSTDTAVTPIPLPSASGITTQDYTFTDLAPGTYYFKVTDDNKCTTTGNYTIDGAVPVKVTGSPVANVTCNTGTDGSIKFTVTNNATVGTIDPVLTKGGLTVTPTLTVTGNVYVYTGLTAGTYIFTATNNVTKCFAISTVSISEPTAITGLAATATKVYSCMPLPKTTTIKVTATGGASPLYYAVVKFGEPIPVFPTDYNTTGIFTKDTGIDGLVYDAYVVDKNGKCPQKLTPVITVENNVAPTVGRPDSQCYSGSAFSITMTGTVFAGSSIQYGINGVYTTNAVKNIPGAGDYNLTVKDDNGCISPVEVYTVLDQLTISAKLDNDITCNIPAAAQITLSAGGGDITDYTYEYKIGLGGSYAAVTGNVLNPTVAGDYYFQVTSGGCSAETTSPVKVTDPAIPTATAVATDPKCNNVSEGTITITPSGGIPGYQYRINGGAWQDSPVFTDLAGAVTPGTLYSYQVKDSKGCVSIAKDIAVTQPSPILVKKSIIGITCDSTTGVSLGSITIDKVTGGTSDYNYYVTGRNYKREFTNVPGTAAVFEIVDFGIYEIRITDANGCVFTEEVTITSPPDDLDITVNAPPVVDCTALGSAVVAIGGALSTIPTGNGPFFFSYYTGVKPEYPTTGVWYSESPAKQATIPGLIPGVRYTFIVFDSKSGCYYYETATMPIPSNSTLTVGAPKAQNITCKGSNDGKVTFNVTSTYSTPTPITYEVYDALSLAPTGIIGSDIVPANETLIISGFGAMPYGDYIVLVKEDVGATNEGCSKSTALFSIRESAELLAVDFAIVQNDNCKTDAGIIKVIGKDGTGPYKYMVTTTAGTPLATDTAWVTAPIFNKDSGNYYAWVKDDFGCIKGTPVFLLPLDLEPVFALSVPNKCATEGNFTVDVTIKDTTIAIPPALPTPSMAPFSVSVNGGAFQSFTGLTYSATGLNSGEHTIIVQDKNGCPIEHKITINAIPLATAEVTKVLNCSGTPNAVVDATITVTIKKGTAPYTYQAYKNDLTVGAVITLGLTDVTFDYPVVEANFGTYKFLITDANSCPVETNPVVIDAIIPIVPAFNAIQPLCNGGIGTIELSATGGSGSYTYDFNNSGVFTNQTIYTVTVGTYPFIVKDALGCEKSGSVILGEPSKVVLGTPTVSPLTCGPGNIGLAATVDLTTGASGGTGTYLYSFDGSAFTDKVIYTVEDNDSEQDIPFAIQDENGCEVSGSVKIVKLNPPTKFDFTPGPVITCIASSTTVEIIDVENALGPVTTGLTYQIIASTSLSPTRNNGTDPLFTDLLPGDYVFQVTDGTGCVKQLPYEIKDVIKINIVEQSTTDITCSTATDGKASFFVSGFGVGTYYYILDANPSVTGLTSATIDLTGLAAGAHKITVYDDVTGCAKFLDFDIAAPAVALAISKVVTPLGCTTFGAVTITATDGWGDYKYTLTQPDLVVLNNNTGIFENLTQDGAYSISVKDGNGCVVTDSFILVPPTPPTATIELASDYCYDGTNAATLVVKASSGVAPYLFSIDNGVTFKPSNTSPSADDTYTFGNLTPGSYDVVVQDAYGCKSILPVNTVIEPQLFAKAENMKNIFCTVGNEDGTIKITALDGYGSYTYTVTKDTDPTSVPIAFTAGSDTADFIVTGPGSYVFVISDAKGCSYTVANAIVMADPTPVKFTVTPTSPSCAGTQGELSDGSILVTLDAVSVDNPDYTYTIVSVPAGYTKTQVNNGSFTGLTAGTYNVTVTSARGCSDAKPVTITAPLVLAVTASVEPLGCSINNTPKDAVVTVTVTPGTGTADYTYSFNGGNFDISNSFAVSTPQTVTYIVLDKNGCRFDGSVVIDAFTPPIDMTIVATPIYCNTANGESTVTVTEVILKGGVIGTGTYTYEIIAPIGVALPNTTGVFSKLLPGIYQIKVTDATGCSKVKTINIEKASEITVEAQLLSDVLCNGDTTGSIAFTISNYIAPADYMYDFTIMPVTGIMNKTGNVITYTGLPKGDYKFTVTDNISGCEKIVDFSIAEPAVALDFTAVATNINCIEKGATITVNAIGGTKNYGYAVEKLGALAPTVFGANPELKIDTNNGVDLDWVVYVQDANGCAISKPLIIFLDASPVINTAVVASQCPSATATFDIIITATGVGPLEYSIGNGFTPNTTITVDAPGTYVVTVRDKNGCTNPVAVSVTILEPLLLDFKTTGTPICNGNQGEVTLLPSGGTGVANYVYSKDNWGSFQNTPIFSGLVPGTYTFSVRDNGTPNQCTKDVVVTFEIPNTAIDFSLTPKAVICNGESNGSIIVNMATTTTTVNNNPIYSFVLTDTASGAIIKGSQTTSVFSGLAAGNYTVIVTSGKGCPVSKDITVLEPKPIVVTAPAVTPYGCTTGNSGNFATITVDPVTGVIGGSGKYVIFEFFRDGVSVYKGSNSIYKEFDFLGGSYTVKVYDSNSCTGTSAIGVTVDPFIRLDKATVKVDNAITCTNFEDITVSTTIIGGTIATLEYSITDAAGNAIVGNPANQTGIFLGLAIGHYIITVNNLDTNCSIKTVHYVNNPNTFAIKATNATNVICYGAADGSVDLTFVDLQPLPDNEAGIFDYTISGPMPNITGTSTDAGPVPITGLKAGLYTVTATLVNKPGCTVVTNFTINQPAALLEIIETHTAITCVAGNNDGTISVSARGGWPGEYQYQLLLNGTEIIGYSTQTEFKGLTEGVYTINVKDSKGCVATTVVTLKVPDPILVNISTITPVLLCNGDKTAEITVALPTGGQGSNYLYTLNTITATGTITSGPHRNPVFTGLGAGIYSVTVTDGFSCAGTSTTIEIREPNEIVSSLVLASSQTCLIESRLTLSATGGTGLYTYSANANFNPILGSFASSTTFDVAVGTYHYYVKDANGCVDYVSNDIKIDPLAPLTINLDETNARINCAGDATGVIVATAQGGLGSYVYTLFDGVAIVQGPKADGNFTGLPAGNNYHVQVESGDCKANTSAIIISEPLVALTSTFTVTNVTCKGAMNGKIEIVATGGTGEIKYAISPNMNQFESKNVFDKLEPGKYEVIVQDILGCFHIIKFDITEPTAIAASVVMDSMIPEVCAGDKDGAFDITVSGGTAPYSVSLDDLNGTYTQGTVGQDVFEFDNLSGGMHIVYIKDAADCLYELEVNMPDAVTIKPLVVIDYACVSNAGANSVTVLVDDSITNPDDVDFSLDGLVYQQSSVFTNLAPGSYTIMARHTNGCIQATAVFEIEAIAPLELVLSDGQLNEVVATATGGGGDYQYSLNGESYGTTNSFIIYKSGNYTVTVSDKNGCTATATRYFEYIDVCIPNHFTPNGDGVNDEWGPGCTINYKNLDYIIFDRYGRQLAKYNLGQKWNGKYNGAELPSGDYWYILKLNDPKDNREFVGHFTLYR